MLFGAGDTAQGQVDLTPPEDRLRLLSKSKNAPIHAIT